MRISGSIGYPTRVTRGGASPSSFSGSPAVQVSALQEEQPAAISMSHEKIKSLLKRAHRIAGSLTRDFHLKEDLAIIGAQKAYERMDRIDTKVGDGKAFLSECMRNAMRDELRKRYRIRERGESELPPIESCDGKVFFHLDLLPNRSEEPSEAAIRNERKDKLYQEIWGLSANCSSVLHCIYYQGMTLEETGVKLGIPVGTVKSRLNRGLQKLRERIAPGYSPLQ